MSLSLSRICLLSAFLFASSCLAAVSASAQEWPARPMTAIVPLGAGSASDLIARVVMEQVGRQLGQPIVVENRPGAGGTIGANAVAKSAPDGYTILVYGALNTAHALYSKLPYDTFADFIPVTSLGQQPLVIVTAPSKGFKTLAEMVAAGKARPGSLNYSSAGVGSASHFGGERLRTTAGFEAQHIPFKGAAEAVTDVVADRSDFSVQLTATTLAAHSRRQACSACGEFAQTRFQPAGCSDHDRNGPAAGIDLSVLYRCVFAGGNPARGRRQTLSRDRQGAGTACGASAFRTARCRADAGYTRGICEILSRRCGVDGSAGESREDSDAINAPALSHADAAKWRPAAYDRLVSIRARLSAHPPGGGLVPA